MALDIPWNTVKTVINNDTITVMLPMTGRPLKIDERDKKKTGQGGYQGLQQN